MMAVLNTGLSNPTAPTIIETGRKTMKKPMFNTIDSNTVWISARPTLMPASSLPSVVMDTRRKYKPPPTQPARMMRQVQPNRLKIDPNWMTDCVPNGVVAVRVSGMMNESKLEIPTGNVRNQLNQLMRLIASTKSFSALVSVSGRGRSLNTASMFANIDEYTCPALKRGPSQRNTSKAIGRKINHTCDETTSKPSLKD